MGYMEDTGSAQTIWSDNDETIDARHTCGVKAFNPAALRGVSNYDRATSKAPVAPHRRTGTATNVSYITGVAMASRPTT